jgi:GT2 family glycosyltransferase
MQQRYNDPLISVIVPTYNRRERLRRLLRRLDELHETGPVFEVVVVVDGATDGTEAMLASATVRYPLRVLTQAQSGPAAARNRAIAAAEGELLLFIDDDVVPVDGMIERHLAVHRLDRRAVVMGAMLPPLGAPLPPWLRWEAATLQKQYDAMTAGEWSPTPRQFYTANASVRREHVLAVGGFDESFRRAEDIELGFRMGDRGLRFYFLPDAAVLHEPDRTFAKWFSVAYEYGQQDVRLYREKGRQYVVHALRDDFPRRHRLNRAVTRLSLGHPRRSRAARTLIGALGAAADRGGASRVAQYAYSALYGLAYYQGFADMLGSTDRFWRIVEDRGNDNGIAVVQPENVEVAL